MNIQKLPVAKLKAAKYNPRRDLRPGDPEYEKLKRSITEFGYVEPVIWNKATGNVVGGHQRLKVLLDMGQSDIDCVVVELDPQKEKALNVALNKVTGAWDNDKLVLLIEELVAADFDVSLTGYGESRDRHYHSSRYHFLNLHSFFSGHHTVELRGFNSELHAGKIRSYIVLALALNNQALTQKSASSKRPQVENEKFAMRTYLNRIGLIGDEFKNCREHLCKHLDGNAAWRFRAAA